MYVSEFTNMYSKNCFIHQLHFISKGEVGANMYLVHVSKNVKLQTCWKADSWLKLSQGSQSEGKYFQLVAKFGFKKLQLPFCVPLSH
jgi:hypothetical protein